MGFGAGMGLPNMKKNTDQMSVTSEVGKGTQVEMITWFSQ
jgi:anti-sigma regulatory factor (Ser/Thr protein kinase)